MLGVYTFRPIGGNLNTINEVLKCLIKNIKLSGNILMKIYQPGPLKKV
tara:strand:- start:1080 stop:1223 length:144 start_codon:yes stop_codon:yes gene_type:complete